ncbi:MAG: TlpA family protein disulfide reductase [Acidobacteria bacterium]|nr:TlpA family protein disulfide reductase [Acidobacteriota bacterium]
MKRAHIVLTLLLTALLIPSVMVSAQAEPGIRGQKAPSWTVDNWFNLEAGTEKIDISDYRGKVVYLFFFQHRCPACHKHGFPTLKAVSERFSDADDVVFVAIQTTWHGVSSDTADKALPTVQKYGLDIPVGHAGAAVKGDSLGIMDAYRTPGTPWAVIVDREGTVQFDFWGIDVADAVNLVDLLRENSTADRK